MRSLAQWIVPALFTGTLAQGAAAADPTDSVNVGEYEHLYAPTMTLLGRADEVDYTFNDAMNYREDGVLRGADIGTRYYPAGGMRGFFTSASLGYWNGSWAFVRGLGTALEYQGTARSQSLRLNFDIGDRIPSGGTSISILPQANLGSFFTSRSCEYTAPAAMLGMSCIQKAEVNAYFFLGVAVGVKF